MTLIIGVFCVDICAQPPAHRRARPSFRRAHTSATDLLTARPRHRTAAGLYWSRATFCCAEVRAILDCSAITTEPCRGFTGCGAGRRLSSPLDPTPRPSTGHLRDCVHARPCALRAQGLLRPSDAVPGRPGLRARELRVPPGAAPGWSVCLSFPGPQRPSHPARPRTLQFPDPEQPLHRLLAGLIMLAIALPTKLVIGRLFELSNGARSAAPALPAAPDGQCSAAEADGQLPNSPALRRPRRIRGHLAAEHRVLEAPRGAHQLVVLRARKQGAPAARTADRTPRLPTRIAPNARPPPPTPPQVRAWKRLWAKYDRDPDLLLLELLQRPLRLLWSVLTRKSALCATPHPRSD